MDKNLFRLSFGRIFQYFSVGANFQGIAATSDKHKPVFVEQSSTIECYRHPLPQFGNDCKQASLFYKTNKYFQIKKK
jgi:hypothetical protein